MAPSSAPLSTQLGLACIGLTPPADTGSLPMQWVAAPLLGDSEVFGELWCSASACRSGEHEGIRYRADAHVLYGVLSFEEGDFEPAAGSAVSALQLATTEAYQRIFRLLDAENYPQLWRVWNYLADINAENAQAGQLERYRQFNIGRQEAFVNSGRLTSGNVPAACALGVRKGLLSIAFMAGRTPTLPLENPRQMSAWDYPDDYGPRAPTFSRGALARLPGQELLFISGTASIVGHRTEHVGDVAGQVQETMANIAAVLGEANRNGVVGQVSPYVLPELAYRVYVRHAADFDVVRDGLQQLAGAEVVAIYVQADICRADLLVEIEATASRDLTALAQVSK